MSQSIPQLLDVFQANAYPGMVEELAKYLGVSAQSLCRLGLGFVPVVDFKKARDFRGWWVFPERDADGVAIGLSLRSQQNDKLMYPGSKHGLFYEVAPTHHQGGATANPGEWVRTMKAGVNCPICGKPDGCMVNSADPENPNGDAICIRVQAGAIRPMKFGWLHSKQTRSVTAGALANNGGPVLIVEGASDAAAALDLGFDVVGRPSNLACMDMLADLVRGRECIVVGENDQKPDGRHPGREGMVATFQAIRRVSRVSMVMPPENAKDLRAWYARFGLTHAALLEHHKQSAEEHPEELILADDRPLTIARAYLKAQHTMGTRTTLRRWQGTWFRYTGSKYDMLDDEAFRAPVYPWSHNKMVVRVAKNGSESVAPLVCNTSMLNNVEEAMMSETLIPGPVMPVWINGVRGPDPKSIIVFANGALDVTAFLNDLPESQYLLDSTPDLFTTIALPFAFNPTAECPNWLAFLTSSLGDDPAKIALLQEWFGYCLTSDTSMQKLMFLRGPTGAGKGVVVDVLCALIGEGQAASTSFTDLSGSFGVQALLGKSICVIPDARTPKLGDSMRGLEILLNIAGGDAIQVNRKFKDPIDRYHFMCRITIASNEFLEVPDHAGAMVRRLNIVEFQRSFSTAPDITIRDRVLPEVAGIAKWSLLGLKRLRSRGRFTVPSSSSLAMQEWRQTTSPLAGFLEECTVLNIEEETDKDALWVCYSGWCRERGLSTITKSRFLERMRSNAPYAIGKTYERVGHKHSVFAGIALKPWAARQYLGKPE